MSIRGSITRHLARPHRWVIVSGLFMCSWTFFTHAAPATTAPTLQVQVGHSEISNIGLSASPTGELIATTDRFGTIKLWETLAGRLVCTLDPGRGVKNVMSARMPNLAWSEDGQQLVSPDGASGLFRWNLDRCGEHEQISLDGSVATPTPPVDTSSRRQPRTPQVRALTSLPGGQALIQLDNTLRVIRPFRSGPASGQGSSVESVTGTINTNAGGTTQLETLIAVSRNGQVALMGNMTGPNRVVDLRSGEIYTVGSLGASQDSTEANAGQPMSMIEHSFALSNTGRYLVLKSSADTVLRVYDLKRRKFQSSVALTAENIEIPSPTTNSQEYSKVIQRIREQSGIAGLTFSTNDEVLYIFRDERSQGSISVELRDASTLSLKRRETSGTLGSTIIPTQCATAIPGNSKDESVLLLAHPTGIRALRVNASTSQPMFSIIEMDTPGRTTALSFSPEGFLSQNESIHKNYLSMTKGFISLRAQPADKQDQQAILALRNKFLSIQVMSWMDDHNSLSSSVAAETTMPRLNVSGFSQDGRFYATQTVSVTGTTMPPIVAAINYWSTSSRSPLWKQDTGESGHFASSIAISPDGKYVAIWSKNNRTLSSDLRILAGSTGQQVSSLEFKGLAEARISYSSDGKQIFVVDDYQNTGVINTENPERPVPLWMRDSSKRYPLGFLPRSGRLVMPSLPASVDVNGSAYQASLWGGWQNVLRVPVPQQSGLAVTDPAESLLAISQGRTIRLFDVRSTPQPMGELQGPVAQVTSMSISPDAKRLLVGDEQGVVTLYDLSRRELLARLYNFSGGNWAVVDRQGRFDTNNVEGLERLHWVMPDEPFRAYPLELFMREYFEPQLLAKLLNNQPLPPVPDVTSINKARPVVSIDKILRSSSAPGSVDVQVTVAPEKGRSGKSSGAVDLKLFRAHLLVGSVPLDSAEVLRSLRSNTPTQVTFRNVRLPTTADPIEFHAYAFNTDGVKGDTAKATFTRSDLGATAAKPARKAYLVSIGVNQHDHADWNLSFAAPDARVTQDVLSRRLKDTGLYSDIVQVPLISDGQSSDAAKGLIRAVTAILAGQPVDPALAARIPNITQLKAATPDDFVLITYAGHGYSDGGDFYLVPQDIGSGRQVNSDTRNHSISTREMSTWLSPIDAGELTLIIDACHAAAAVDSEGFKPGPMGAKGFGQLAYDKGMRVLTATQSDDVALESARLQQGLLTYALVTEGLVRAQADTLPKDGEIRLSEWLNFGVRRVPDIYHELRSGQKSFNDGQAAWTYVSRAASRQGSGRGRTQQPTLFNFRHDDTDSVVADLKRAR